MATRIGAGATGAVGADSDRQAALAAKRRAEEARKRQAEEARRREAERAERKRAQESGASGVTKRRPKSLEIESPVKPDAAVTDKAVDKAQVQNRTDREKEKRRAANLQDRAERAERVPLSAEDRKLTADFRKDERAAFRELTPGEREKFAKVYDYLYRKDRSGKEARQSREAREGLRTALKNGAMLQTDREGTTTLDNFAKRMGQELAPELKGRGLHPKGQLENLARAIGNPAGTFQGAGTKDCVAASAQSALARKEPAEFLRVATGLAFDGKVKLKGPGGAESTMKLDTRSLWDDKGPKVRDSTSQLIQQSFNSYARKNFAGGDKEGWAGGQGQQGLSIRQAEGLYENVTGEAGSAVKITDQNREQALGAIERASRSGKKFQLGFGSDEGGHMVTLLGITKDKKGNQVAKFADSETGTQRRMKWSEFKKLLKGAVVPSAYARKLVGSKAGKDDFGGGNIPVDSGAINGAAPQPAASQAAPPPAAPPRPVASSSYWNRRYGSSGRG